MDFIKYFAEFTDLRDIIFEGYWQKANISFTVNGGLLQR